MLLLSCPLFNVKLFSFTSVLLFVLPILFVLATFVIGKEWKEGIMRPAWHRGCRSIRDFCSQWANSHYRQPLEIELSRNQVDTSGTAEGSRFPERTSLSDCYQMGFLAFSELIVDCIVKSGSNLSSPSSRFTWTSGSEPSVFIGQPQVSPFFTIRQDLLSDLYLKWGPGFQGPLCC